MLRETSSRAWTCAVAQDHRIGQFCPVTPMKLHGALGNLLIDCDHLEAAQKIACRCFELCIDADHHLHPGDDAHRLFGVALQLGACLRNSIEIVDQDVGVEQRLHHSPRTFSW
jgi:hypothetical protein